MRIGFDAKRAFFNHSGLGNYSRFVIEALSSNYPDNDYLLYTPKVGGEYAGSLPGDIKSPQGVGRYLSSLWRVKHLGKRAAADKVDVFHGLSNEIPSDLKSPSIKKVVTIHDVIFNRYPEFYKAIDRKIYNKKTQYSCDLADSIVVVSSQTKEDLLSYYKVDEQKIEVIGQDCHPQFSVKSSEESIADAKNKYGLMKPYLICVGTIEERKNQVRIAEAFLKSSLANEYELHFFGRKTKYQGNLEGVIGDSQVIRIHNNASFSDFPSIYQGSKGMVYVSLFEGFGIPLVEAMHSKIPLITSKGGCFREVAGDGAVYVDATSIEDITTGLETLVEDDQAHSKLKSSQEEQLRLFSAETISKKLMEVYNG